VAASSPTFRRGMTAAACALAGAAIAFGPATTGNAAPKPSENRLRAELAALNKKVDKLIGEYNAKRVALAEAQRKERAAADSLTKAEEELKRASAQVAEIAQLSYQGGERGLADMLFAPSIDGAALVEQLAAEQAAHLEGYTDARDRKRKAADQAAKLTDEIRGDAEELTDQRKEAESLIGEIEKKLDQLVPVASGRRGNGTWAPELPTGSDNITPRTRLMREEIKERFDLPFSVGCFRAGSFGEHPLGRACDFMMSTGGSMPSAGSLALGDQIAEWALQNQGKLGVKYVIWKQRINHGSGWRGMSDRGSVTENHWDHVHISMH
jgi:hypothetical protein